MKNKTFLKIPALLIMVFSFFAISTVSNADGLGLDLINSKYDECVKGDDESCVMAENLRVVAFYNAIEKLDALNEIDIKIEKIILRNNKTCQLLLCDKDGNPCPGGSTFKCIRGFKKIDFGKITGGNGWGGCGGYPIEYCFSKKIDLRKIREKMITISDRFEQKIKTTDLMR